MVKTLKLLKTDIEALSDHLLNQMKEIQNIYVNIFSISDRDAGSHGDHWRQQPLNQINKNGVVDLQDSVEFRAEIASKPAQPNKLKLLHFKIKFCLTWSCDSIPEDPWSN